jgi:hypothetical protein
MRKKRARIPGHTPGRNGYVMGPTPSGYRSMVVRFAITALLVAVALNVAIHLILAVASVLIGLGIFGLLAYVSWRVYRFRRSRW